MTGDELPLRRRASSELLNLIVDARNAELLGHAIEPAVALDALAARAELTDRFRHHRWLAVETARRAGASWDAIDAALGVPTGAARREYETALARQKAFGLVAPDRADPGMAPPAGPVL